MLLRGVFVFRIDSDEPVHEFAIRHPQIGDLTQARIRIRRYGRNRYVYSSQSSLLMEESVCGFHAHRLAGFGLWWTSLVTVFKRPAWSTLRPFLKAVLRNKPTALDDLLASAWMVGIETNDGKQSGQEVVFDDGTRSPLVSRIVRNGAFAGSKLVLFPHFEPNEEVSEQDLTSLRFLKEAGYDIVVLSTSLGSSGIARLGFVNAIVVRPNVGHDFFSWKVGFLCFADEIRSVQHLLLLNNSVFISGAQTLAELDALPDGFGCLLDSPSAGYHAESYCLLFKNMGDGNRQVFDFFEKVVVHQAKQQVILAYEIGLSRFFLDRGYRLHSVRPYEKLLASVLQRKQEYPELARLLERDPVQSSCTTFREYLIDEGFTILKKRKD